MRCDKMHATIRVAQCLKNQQATLADGRRSGTYSLRYIGCKECDTGAAARAGRLNDDDVKTLFEQLRLRKNPPAETLPEPRKAKRTAEPKNIECRTEEVEKQQPEPIPKEERMKEKITKECKHCNKTKPLDEFLIDKHGADGHKSKCKECNRVWQTDFARRKRAQHKAAMDELARLRDGAQTPEKEADESVGANGRSPHTAPAACIQGEITSALSGAETGINWIQAPNLVTLDFSPYPEILEEIKRIAAEEERPPEVQARLMLKRLLKSCHAPLSTFTCSTPGYKPMFIDANTVFGDSDRGIPIIDPPEHRMGPPEVSSFKYRESSSCA